MSGPEAAGPILRYMLIDEDGVRLGRFETSQLSWSVGDTLVFDDREWRIVDMRPEVSTFVAYLGVWVIVPVDA